MCLYRLHFIPQISDLFIKIPLTSIRQYTNYNNIDITIYCQDSETELKMLNCKPERMYLIFGDS